jgi:hypothetical protein
VVEVGKQGLADAKGDGIHLDPVLVDELRVSIWPRSASVNSWFMTGSGSIQSSSPSGPAR